MKKFKHLCKKLTQRSLSCYEIKYKPHISIVFVDVVDQHQIKIPLLINEVNFTKANLIVADKIKQSNII